MRKLFAFLLLLSLQGLAQEIPIDADSLLAKPLQRSLDYSWDQTPLLPERMLFTQRIFWGPNGLLRVMNIAPLTQRGRQQEIKVRRFMLITHQVTGYATLAGFLMQGILGTKLANATGADYTRLYQWQQTTATITNIAYGTTALLSLTAPPKQGTNRAKAKDYRLHQYLSLIHLSGFIATNILAGRATQHAELRPYHQAASFTTAAALAPALIALKF
jgi:hypothetical protein